MIVVNKEELLDIIKLNESNLMDKKIYKNMIEQNISNSNEKNIINNYIKSIYWIASFKLCSSYISYVNQFKEMELLYINVKNIKNTDKIFRLFSKIIFKPLCIMFCDNKNYSIYVARYKINVNRYLTPTKVLKSKLLDKNSFVNIISNDYFKDALRNDNLNPYECILKFISLYNLDNIDILNNISNFDPINLEELRLDLEKLKRLALREKQLNLKVNLLKKIKIKENKINKILGGQHG